METTRAYPEERARHPSKQSHAILRQLNEEIQGEKFKGARRTTLPTVLKSDLDTKRKHKLSTADDLKALAEVAQNRVEWKSLMGKV